jgi:superoxide reductase
MNEQKFFKCDHCGNLLGLIHNAGVPMICCGEKMKELIPNTVEAAVEKHLPVFEKDGDTIIVSVGSVLHPMTEEHHIEFVYLQTEHGGQRKFIKLGADPVVKFALADDKPICVFAYCNLHGLWKANF